MTESSATFPPEIGNDRGHVHERPEKRTCARRRAESSRYQLRVALILSMKEIVTVMGQRNPTSWYKESP